MANAIFHSQPQSSHSLLFHPLLLRKISKTHSSSFHFTALPLSWNRKRKSFVNSSCYDSVTEAARKNDAVFNNLQKWKWKVRTSSRKSFSANKVDHCVNNTQQRRYKFHLILVKSQTRKIRPDEKIYTFTKFEYIRFKCPWALNCITTTLRELVGLHWNWIHVGEFVGPHSNRIHYKIRRMKLLVLKIKQKMSSKIQFHTNWNQDNGSQEEGSIRFNIIPAWITKIHFIHI